MNAQHIIELANARRASAKTNDDTVLQLRKRIEDLEKSVEGNYKTDTETTKTRKRRG